MNDGKYGFVCIDSESEECRRDIEARNKSKKWAKTLECGGADHPNRRRVLLTQRPSPFVDDNGHPLDHDTAIAVFKVLEHRRERRVHLFFMAIFLFIIIIGAGKGIYDYAGRNSNTIEYFPEKKISDCKLKRILYFSGKNREYACPDGSLVVVGKDVRNKNGE